MGSKVRETLLEREREKERGREGERERGRDLLFMCVR